MAVTFVFDQGRSSTDWEVLLFGDDGVFNEPRKLAQNSGTDLGSVHVQLGTTRLTFISSDGDLSVAGKALTGGTITSIVLESDGNDVIHLDGLSLEAATVQALLDEGAETGRDALFQAVFASEATSFFGPLFGVISAFGSASDDEFTLFGTQNNLNFVWTGGGEDTIHGSDAEDFIAYDASELAVTVDFAGGTVVQSDTTSLGTFDSAVEDIAGSQFADTFNGDDRTNNVWGNSGDDTFNGAGGNDFFVGGAGDDVVDGGEGWDKISYLRSENQTQGVTLTYDAGSGLSGTVTDLYGDTDTFAGIEGAQGGNFNDKLKGNNADNNFEGMDGNDTLIGGGGNDYLNGGDGNDSLDGGKGNDFFEGGRGKDSYAGFASDDDWDKVSYEHEEGGKGIKATYKGNGKIEVTDTYGNTEKGTGIDEIKGSRWGDKITGSSEGDVTEGMGGADTFNMGDGRDKVEYQHEAEDAGTTRGIIANLSGASLTEDIGFGNKTVAAGHVLDSFGKMDTLTGVEEITGTMYRDHMAGGNGSNSFEGQGGNDGLFGNGGEDFFQGDDGKDTIDGGKGDDHMDGGAGKDKLTGGSGEDDFNFGLMGKANADTITDFKSGEDELWLWDDTFGLGSGKLLKNNQFLAGDGLHDAATSKQHVIYDTDSGNLYFDRDGKGGDHGILVAILKGGVELHASDIQLG